MSGVPQPDLLDRYPLQETSGSAVAQTVPPTFWPAHHGPAEGRQRSGLVLNRVFLGQLAVTFARCMALVRITPSKPCRAACLVVPLDGVVEIETDSGSFQARSCQVIFCSPGWIRRFEASSARCLTIDMLAPALTTAGQAAGHAVPLPLRDAAFTGRQAEALRRSALAVVKLANTNRRVAGLQTLGVASRVRMLSLAMKQREDALLMALATAVCVDERPEPAAVSTPDGAEIEAWLAEHALSSRSLADLATQAGITLRTIQRACQKIGSTPQAVLRSVRLDRAREMLSNPESGITVADVATAVCTPHVGRFSQYYRERFGELPSDTREKARQRSLRP